MLYTPNTPKGERQDDTKFKPWYRLHNETLSNSTKKATILESQRFKVGEMAHRLRALTAFAEDWGSIPSTHMRLTTPVTLAPEDVTPSSCLHRLMQVIHIIHTDRHTYTEIIKEPFKILFSSLCPALFSAEVQRQVILKAK